MRFLCVDITAQGCLYEAHASVNDTGIFFLKSKTKKGKKGKAIPREEQ